MKKLITTAFLMTLVSASYGQDADRAESIVDGLSRLAELHKEGLLNDEEFNLAKRQLLGVSSPSQARETRSDEPVANSNVPSERVVETINYSDATYVGEVQDGKKDGRGTLTWHNGNEMKGLFRDNELINGTAKLTFDNGDEYSGNMFNGEREGRGTYRFANGNVYTGNWRAGKLSGRGTYTWTDGRSYEGNWFENKQSGGGVYTFPSGYKESGHYSAGKWIPNTKSTAQRSSNNSTSQRSSSNTRKSRSIDWGEVGRALGDFADGMERVRTGGGSSAPPFSQGNINNHLISTEGVIGATMCRYQDGSVLRIGGGMICPLTN